MRFTQFGHHVPRRNSRISVPFSIRPLRVNVPLRLAAPREKSGARDPISRVSVRLCMLSSTVSEAGIRKNNGWGTGMTRYLQVILGGTAGFRCDPGVEFRRVLGFFLNYAFRSPAPIWA